MDPLHITTPLILSQPLSRKTGRRVWLKVETLQPTYSFKIRGIGHRAEALAKAGTRTLVSSSGGNAGLAVAYAGRMLNLSVHVYVPESTPSGMQQRIEDEGAEVSVRGAHWSECHDQLSADLSAGVFGDKAAYVHPFDHEDIWHGHSSLIDEVVHAGLKPQLVTVAVGGGGLYAGIVRGLQRAGLHNTTVIACETKGAACFKAAITAGQIVSLDHIDTVATSLGATSVCEEALKLAATHPTGLWTCTDEHAIQAAEQFFEDHLIAVEPACGAAISPLLHDCPEIERAEDILVVVCGGYKV